jgi:hypothetical protein
MIAPQSPIFGLVRVSPRMLLCCKTPLHGVEDDARMLEMQGGGLKIKDEASMEVLVLHVFRKREGCGEGEEAVRMRGKVGF